MPPDLGDTCRDTVTGFIGTLTCIAQYWKAAARYQLTPKVGADNKYIDSEWFDLERIEKVA